MATTASGAIIRMRVEGADASQRQIQAVSQSMTRMSDIVHSAMNRLAGTIGLGGGIAAIVALSDEYAKFTSQLRLATSSQREYAIAYEDVKRISKVAQSDLAGTGMLYARIANGTRELGKGQKNVADITEVVNLALRVSAATTSEAASAQLQLSQAFASGTLRGEEFNAVNEAAPRLMKALADGMGVPVGALKQMATDGKITSKIMAEVLPGALEKLREEAKQVQTIGGAFTVLKNNIMEFTATKAQANGTVSALTGSLTLLADNLVLVTGLVTTMTASKLAAWLYNSAAQALSTAAANRALAASTLAAAVTTTEAAATGAAAKLAEAQANVRTSASSVALANARVAELRAAVLAADGAVALAIATNGLIPAQARAIAMEEAHTVSLAAMAVAGNVATTTAVASAGALGAQAAAATIATRAMGALRATIAFFGGPLGAIVTLLGIAATAWMVWGNKAKEATVQAAESFDEAQARIIKGLDEQIDKNNQIIKLKNLGMKTSDAEKALPYQKQLAAASNLLNDINNRTGEYASKSISNTAVDLARIKVLKDITDLSQKMQTADKTGAAVAAQTTAERVKALKEEYATKQEKMDAEIEKIKDLKGKTAEYDVLVQRIRDKYKEKDPSVAALKQEATAYTSLITSIGEKIAANKLEMNGYNKLSESQKMAIKLDEAIESGKNKLNKKHIEEARSLIAIVAAQEASIASHARMADFNEQYSKGLAVADNIQEKAIETATEEARKNEELAATFGMTKTAIEQLELARLEQQLAQRASSGLTLDEIDHLEKLIAVKKRSAAAVATVEGLEEQKKVWESIDKTAHDTFVSIFDSGKSAFDRLEDTLKNGVLDLLYQMTIKKWIMSISASVGVGGVAGVGQAADALGGGAASSNPLISMVQSASTMYKAVTGGFAAIGDTVAGAVQTGMTALGYTPTAASGLATAGGQALTPFASGAGAFAGAAAGVLGGVMGGRLISGQFGSNTTVNVGTAVGAVIGSVVPVIGTAIGALVGGLLGGVGNRLFGMGDKNVTATGMAGTVSDSGLTGTTYQKWSQKGGVFRSDKSGTDKTAFDAEVTAQFTQGFSTIKAASAGFAASIGASASSLVGYSKTFDIALTKDAAANEKAMTDFFNGVSDEIALRLVPGLGQFTKSGETMSATLQRLASDFEATNQVAVLLGKNGTSMFGSLTIDSAGARERLIELAGGVSNLSSQAASFNQNYLTEAERIKPVADAVAAAMAGLGLANITSRDQFKTTLLALNPLNAAQAQQIASMLALQEAFAQVHPAIEATTTALRTEADVLSERQDLQKRFDAATMTTAQIATKARLAIAPANLALYDQVMAQEQLKEATEAASSALKTTIDGLTATRTSNLAYRDSLMTGSLSTLTPMQKYLETQKQYATALTKAKAAPDNAAATSAAQEAATAFLTASQVINSSSAAFVSDRSGVLRDMTSLADIAGAQISEAQKQLDMATQQVTGITTLNTTAVGIQQAIVDLSRSGTVVQAPALNMDRYASASNDGQAVLVAEIKRLNARMDDLIKVNEGRRSDAARQHDETLDVIDEVAPAVGAKVGQFVNDLDWEAKNPSRVPAR
jgi:tape measure domain-containing protein